VSSDAPPGGDGATWATAFNDLQDALDAARLQPLSSFQQIWVGPGTYFPDQGLGVRTSSFVIDRPMSIIGGFAGTESTATERNPSTPRPILSGEIGAPNTPGDNSLHVVVVSDGTTQSSVHDVIIQDGNANDAMVSFGRSGGGVLVINGSPTLHLCLVHSNTARDGAGIYVDTGSPIIESCVVRANVATTSGGGAYLGDGGYVTSCIFDSNTGPTGAGLFVCCGPGEVRLSSFTSNFGNSGGGMFLGVGSGPVSHCLFHANTASRGGGIYGSQAGCTIAACRFASNAANEGAGVYFDLGGTVVDSLFTRNCAISFGGAIYARNNPSIIGCTLYSNGAGFTGGGIHHASGTTNLANCILWANTDSSGTGQQAQVIRSSGTLAPIACCVQGWNGSLGGSMNTGWAPGLDYIVGPDGLLGTPDDDPSLAGDSPCIDAGANTSWPQDLADLDRDANTAEIVPLDLLGSARAIDDPLIPDTGAPGAGLPAIADIGAAESLPGCVGDLNIDLLVNVQDFNILAQSFGAVSATPSQGDINHDDVVNVQDFNILAARFGAECD